MNKTNFKTFRIIRYPLLFALLGIIIAYLYSHFFISSFVTRAEFVVNNSLLEKTSTKWIEKKFAIELEKQINSGLKNANRESSYLLDFKENEIIFKSNKLADIELFKESIRKSNSKMKKKSLLKLENEIIYLEKILKQENGVIQLPIIKYRSELLRKIDSLNEYNFFIFDFFDSNSMNKNIKSLKMALAFAILGFCLGLFYVYIRNMVVNESTNNN